MIRKLRIAVVLAAVFCWELVISSLRVAWDVVTPRAWRRPGIVAVPLTAYTDAEITLLANLVTLPPGSLSLDVSDNRSTLYVHAMFADEGVEQAITGRFERRLLELMR